MSSGPKAPPWARSPDDPTEPTISARGIAKARGTVEDFVLSCFPLLGLPLSDVLAFGDTLYFVEASLYEADESNEAGDIVEGGAAMSALVAFLRARGLFDSELERELHAGAEYWRLERSLVESWRNPPPAAICARAMIAPPPAPLQSAKYVAGPDPDAMRGLANAKLALLLKSFDYRVLLAVTMRLKGQFASSRSAALTSFLSSAFTLVELQDDLGDYYDDVVDDTFNVYRAFVRAYGESAPVRLCEWIRELENDYLHKRDAAALPPSLLAAHTARNEQQGGAGPVMAPTSGCWKIPCPIAPDEDTFRRIVAISGCTPPVFIERTIGFNHPRQRPDRID